VKRVGAGLFAASLLVLMACTSPRAESSGRPKAPPTSPVPPVGQPLRNPEGTTFAACPDVSEALPVGPQASATASAVAIRFVRSNPQVASALADPVASLNGLIPHAPGDSRLSVVGSRSARNDGLVAGACGHLVAARSWRVTIDDGTTSSSLDTWLYLDRLRGGWKVWGDY
jgi:hypothetical protein